MKRLLMFLVVCLMAVQGMTEQVLWAGVYPDAKIHKGDEIYSWTGFADMIGQDIENIGFRIIINGVEMPLGSSYPSGYIPPGQSAPTIYFDYPGEGQAYEAGVGSVDNDDVWTGDYADWQPVRLDIVDELASVIFEIGYWNENDNWNFISVAYSEPVSLGSLWNDHTYTTGTLAPPTENPWRPTDFYMPVPEPSIGVLIALGMLPLLLIRRRPA